MRKPKPIDKVLVIRSPSDAKSDYYLSKQYAEAEYDAGRLFQTPIYGRWQYFDPDGHHIAHKIL